jgi:NAD(P)-dependent dehydrogenase (short-subunit alcohol dehydrogenase family)
MQVTNKTVLLTGANGGLGLALITALLDAGASKVYAACRAPERLTLVDPRVVPLTLDATSPVQIASVRRLAKDVDILINNAGLNRQQRLLDASEPEAAHAEMAVNYFATLNLCRAYAGLLGERQGAIVNVLSILARVALPAMGSLCASKAAALRLTEGLRAELASAQVQVMAVLPGVIDTAMSRDFPGPKASPEDIAQAIISGLLEGTSTLYPDPMSQQVAQGLAADREATVAGFAAFL